MGHVRWPWKAFAATLLVSLAATCWFLSNRLCQTEREVVGTWYHHNLATPDMSVDCHVVWVFRPDRSCKIFAQDSATGQVLDIGPLVGRWWVEDGAVVCDWDQGLLARARRMLRFRSRQYDVNAIESITGEEMLFRPRGGTPYELKRLPYK
jgi:hypothetical protein